MGRDVYFVKSFEEDFATKTLKGEEKVTYQTVQNIQLQPVFSSQTELTVSPLVSQIGRGPPTV